mmetsp:Transcript_20286/g.24241  ORF Transcript_20286/g.24241 Transcript_20286/m.24241 type:complete len:128 (-) Transcript_20286:265-648(-)|eukprot:CAMPEP_0197850750 /NCGR_PEP_ID=MMETSP1438-20131217/16260_1 /TAXON_ID=1461541 /ORGANISM="Pterosperma sp., Strain CCMP1384" /LENGTH=127 /DNA_ID=CAMNT_0043464081 /DNA_START=334 /DNA_END=717 /DNA_ORIENTATION=+
MFFTRVLSTTWKNLNSKGGVVWRSHESAKISQEQRRNAKRNLARILANNAVLKFAAAEETKLALEKTKASGNHVAKALKLAEEVATAEIASRKAILATMNIRTPQLGPKVAKRNRWDDHKRVKRSMR